MISYSDDSQGKISSVHEHTSIAMACIRDCGVLINVPLTLHIANQKKKKKKTQVVSFENSAYLAC